MGLKILHSADWHLDSPFGSFLQDRREFLRQAQLQIPGKIRTLCVNNHCDLLLLAGDLFDGPWSRDTLDIVRQELEACKIPVMIAPGNHDPWGPECPWLESWPENVHVFGKNLESVLLPELDCRIYGAGFSGMDCGSLLEGFHADGGETCQIGLFHGDPTNAGSPYNPVTSRQIRESGLQYLALGHIHAAGGLEVEHTVCSWPGSPMGRGWDETGPKGCLLAEVGAHTQVHTVSMGLPEFFREQVELTGGKVPSFDTILPPAGNRNFYQITVTGYGKIDLSDLYRKYYSFPNLEILDETVDADSLWQGAGEDSLRGEYFQKLKNAALEADPETRKKIMLAAEISQKLLDGREVQLP